MFFNKPEKLQMWNIEKVEKIQHVHNLIISQYTYVQSQIQSEKVYGFCMWYRSKCKLQNYEGTRTFYALY